MNNTKLSDDAWESQATQVGMEFKPGPQANAEIERLRGFISDVFGGKAMRRAPTDFSELQWLYSPDYCGEEDTVAVELLDALGVGLFVLSTEPDGLEYLALFEHQNKLYVTVPFPTETQAAACALWFVLSE